MDLSVSLGPLTLKNPIMTASGCCEYGLELAEFFPLDSIGAVVVKGLSPKPRKGNPIPRIAETSSGMLNSIGLQNIGVDAFIREKLPDLLSLGATVAANIFGETIEDYVMLARFCNEAGIPALELNLSCPNVHKGGMEFGVDPDVLHEITSRCRAVYAGSLWVKLTPNITSIVPLAEAAKSAGADAVTCINTLRGMAIDIKTGKPKLHTIFGGLSGPAIKPVALRFTYEVASRVGIPVIGCGGIVRVEDIVEFLLAGATAVQVGTILFREPDCPTTLVHGLSSFMEARGLSSIHDLIGKMVRHGTP